MTTKKERTSRTKPDAPGADAASKGHNGPPPLTADEERELFATHRSAWNGWQAKLKQIEKTGKDVKAALKSDGFTIAQMKIADQLANDDTKVKAEVENRLKVARWLGHPMGAQLDMFADRVPISDRAFEEGKQASIEDRPAKPGYDPDTEAYRNYMAGYHEHQREIVGGMKAAGDANQSTLANP
jgi:hypothetical protein